MSTYNPYAFQSYEVKASVSNKRYADNKSHAAVSKLKEFLHKQQLSKWFLCLFVILLFVTSFYLVRAAASTTSDDHIAIGEEKVITVSSGDTLWEIAAQHYSHIQDKNYAVYLIKDRNGLSSNIILPGDKLILPEE
ncbi:hypothetical protein J40TS1_05770 [Paenibacillus montaniterrae]|uniref:LysM domain-containing protein n=1 Tax=Paenibacillus montaniterrae TaxID=429341 RepID=A0A919YKL9_9BACL|nr:LysM peptidoglycan-binding domain-containing protein [Paenibacillus montaniterrae]GIP14935.1 hypothetical protein J40TS1_05770 [Paenibacillus montaniterrae]